MPLGPPLPIGGCGLPGSNHSSRCSSPLGLDRYIQYLDPYSPKLMQDWGQTSTTRRNSSHR